MALIRVGRPEDVAACVDLAEAVLGPTRSGPFVQAAHDRRELLVAHFSGEVVGTLAYRSDWFGCTLVTLVSVRSDWWRRGVARALYRVLEERSPNPRLFSSAEETNGAAIQMHRALGFIPSGHVDNLPQGYRELLFYRRRDARGPFGAGSG